MLCRLFVINILFFFVHKWLNRGFLSSLPPDQTFIRSETWKSLIKYIEYVFLNLNLLNVRSGSLSYWQHTKHNIENTPPNLLFYPPQLFPVILQLTLNSRDWPFHILGSSKFNTKRYWTIHKLPISWLTMFNIVKRVVGDLSTIIELHFFFGRWTDFEAQKLWNVRSCKASSFI